VARFSGRHLIMLLALLALPAAARAQEPSLTAPVPPPARARPSPLTKADRRQPRRVAPIRNATLCASIAPIRSRRRPCPHRRCRRLKRRSSTAKAPRARAHGRRIASPRPMSVATGSRTIATPMQIATWWCCRAGLRARRGRRRIERRGFSRWWSQGESNPRPLECHSSALPTELWPLKAARRWDDPRADSQCNDAGRLWPDRNPSHVPAEYSERFDASATRAGT
jgi:hypothetical protein